MTHQNRSHKITFKERPRKTRERFQKHHFLLHSSSLFLFFFKLGWVIPIVMLTKLKFNDYKASPSDTEFYPSISQTSQVQYSINRIGTNSNRRRSRKKEMNTGSSITIRVAENKSNYRRNPCLRDKSSQSLHGKPISVEIDNSSRTNPSNTSWGNASMQSLLSRGDRPH